MTETTMKKIFECEPYYCYIVKSLLLFRPLSMQIASINVKNVRGVSITVNLQCPLIVGDFRRTFASILNFEWKHFLPPSSFFSLINIQTSYINHGSQATKCNNSQQHRAWICLSSINAIVSVIRCFMIPSFNFEIHTFLFSLYTFTTVRYGTVQ